MHVPPPRVAMRLSAQKLSEPPSCVKVQHLSLPVLLLAQSAV